MANRIIINNKSDLSDYDAMLLVLNIIGYGRISNNNKQYCYYVISKLEDKEYHISCDLRKNSDSFTII